MAKRNYPGYPYRGMGDTLPAESSATQAQIEDACVALQSQINDLLAERTTLRHKEQDLKARWDNLSTQFQPRGGNNVRSYLETFLPPHLMPQNLGDITEVAWPFWFPVDIDFGVDPVLTNTSIASGSFQVTQEAGFLMLGITVSTDDVSQASILGPYQVTIRDNQSSRQFNDRPIPIQCLGANSLPTILPTPLLFQPNASVTLNMSTWLPVGVSMPTVGSGKFQIGLSGLRVRVDDASRVLSTIFTNG